MELPQLESSQSELPRCSVEQCLLPENRLSVLACREAVRIFKAENHVGEIQCGLSAFLINRLANDFSDPDEYGSFLGIVKHAA